MFNKVELIVGGASVVAIVTAFVVLQDRVSLFALTSSQSQVATVQSGLQVSSDVIAETVFDDSREKGMEINDIKVGDGAVVKEGDTVSVHYVGAFQDGQEFDSSKGRGVPFEFTVGARQVIAGWEQGLLGMKVGGERVLVVPPDLAYGERGIGPIPGGATLIFTIELLDIK